MKSSEPIIRNSGTGIFRSRAVQSATEWWPLFPAAIYLFGFLIVVIVYLLVLALSTGHNGMATFPSLKTVSSVVASPDFREAFFNTLIFVMIGTPLELLAGLALALVLYKTFIFRGLVRSLLLIPLAIPTLVTATLLFIIFDYPGGHINDLLVGKYPWIPAVLEAPISWRASKFFSLGISMLGKIWRDMPISMLILLAGLNSIDPQLLDAASTMGAGLRKRLRFIILPLMMPSISAVLLLRSVEVWKEFIFPFVLAGRYNLLGTLIESFYNEWGQPHEAAFTALTLVVCILVSSAVIFAVTAGAKRLMVRI